MDGEDKQHDSKVQPPVPQQPPLPAEPKSISKVVPVNETGKTRVAMSEAEVQSLLMITGAQTSSPQKKKLPLGIIFTIIVLVILLSMAGPLISHITRGKNSKQQSAGTSNQQKSDSQSTTDEVNNDVQSCKNVVNALSEC